MKSLNLVISGTVNDILRPVLDDLHKQGCSIQSVEAGKDVTLESSTDAILIPVSSGTVGELHKRQLFERSRFARVLMFTDNDAIDMLDPISVGAQAMVFAPFHPAAVLNAIETAIRIQGQQSTLEESLAHYMESHKHLGEAILLTDKAGLVLFANDWAKTLLGVSDVDLNGQHVADVFPIDDEDLENPLEDLADQVGEGSQLVPATRATIRGADGQAKEVLFQVKTIGDEKAPDGMLLVFHEYRLRKKPKQVVTLKEGDKSSPVRNGDGGDDDMRVVRIQTFGEFQISIDDEVIDVHRWRSKKALDALCLLLHSYGKPVQKDILIDFLWPDADGATGNRRLLNVISELRKYLEPNAKRYSRNNFIRHESGMYRLSFEDNVYLDAALFRDLIRQGDYHWGVGEYRMARTYYQEALQHKFGVFMPRYLNSPLFDEAREYFEETEERIRQRLGFDAERQA
ncbi:PAS domain-containing protein [bacterium]|nr:PAS domain-containing protein [bacterium]